jgi:hypothetical protein
VLPLVSVCVTIDIGVFILLDLNHARANDNNDCCYKQIALLMALVVVVVALMDLVAEMVIAVM